MEGAEGSGKVDLRDLKGFRKVPHEVPREVPQRFRRWFHVEKNVLQTLPPSC